MRIIDIGAMVITLDGKRSASVERVIMDPSTKEITYLVLHKGMLLTRHVVVPLSSVQKAESGVVYLGLTAEQLQEMPELVESDYVMPQQASAIGPYIPGDVLWPTAYAYAPVVTEERRNVPENAIEITEGTDVVCPDGKVGVVDEVIVSEDEGAVGGFVLRRGTLGRRDGVVPVDWVEYADSAVVRLNRPKKEVEEYLHTEDIRG